MIKTGFYINWPYFDQPTRARGLGPRARGLGPRAPKAVLWKECICWALLTAPSLSPQMWEL